jgi:hypothetical protein
MAPPQLELQSPVLRLAKKSALPANLFAGCDSIE